MCLGIPGLVTELEADARYALVDVSGARRRVNIELLEDHEVKRGDWVLIHVGFALTLLDEDEARSALELLEGMAVSYAEELAAMARSADATPGQADAGAPTAGPVRG
ncbi:MAG TPA: HypC/HybG/HupF family hydrogenase formation chaperone [Acidimicrobiales bacterium]|nr:HypC/HybG/HupF family hydrogenase formation chaperone [Acidimicrobiales bacterium]